MGSKKKALKNQRKNSVKTRHNDDIKREKNTEMAGGRTTHKAGLLPSSNAINFKGVLLALLIASTLQDGLTKPTVSRAERRGRFVHSGKQGIDDHNGKDNSTSITTSKVGFFSAVGANQINEAHWHSVINAKTIIDQEVSNVAKVAQACEKVTGTILTAIARQHHEHITRALTHEGPLIACTDQDRMETIRGIKFDRTLPRAFFKAEQHLILVAISNSIKATVDEEILSHEFMHMDNFFLRKQGKCLEKDDGKAIIPVFPFNDENIRKYHNAFDKGDKRINEFKQLLLKQQGKKLSAKEFKKLTDYQGACQTDVPLTFKHDITEADYNHFLTLEAQYGQQKKFTSQLLSGEQIELIAVEKEENNYIGISRYTDPFARVIKTPDNVADQLNSPLYKDKASHIKLAEREAYTFSPLFTQEAKVFYKEAYAMREQYIQQCTGFAQNDHQVEIDSIKNTIY